MFQQRVTTSGRQREARTARRGFEEAETEDRQRQRAVCVTSERRDSEEEEVGRRMVFFGQPRAVELDC